LAKPRWGDRHHGPDQHRLGNQSRAAVGATWKYDSRNPFRLLLEATIRRRRRKGLVIVCLPAATGWTKSGSLSVLPPPERESVKIDNFRGIRKLRWAPNAKMNCLIGPGDSTKTTILDAIELALNPRSPASSAPGANEGGPNSEPHTWQSQPFDVARKAEADQRLLRPDPHRPFPRLFE
jgi:hypothetical protein